MKIVDILFLALFPIVDCLKLGRSPVLGNDGSANSNTRSPGSISIEIPGSPVAYADEAGHIELGMRSRFSPAARGRLSPVASSVTTVPNGSFQAVASSATTIPNGENDEGVILPRRSLHIMKFVSVVIPCLNNYLITLNVYNGDLLGHYIKNVELEEDFEYMIWFVIPLVINIIFDLVHTYGLARNSYDLVPQLLKKLYISCYFVWIIGIGTNLYWYYFSPWKLDPPPHRHRTEYYDSRALLCAMSYTQLLLFEKIIIF